MFGYGKTCEFSVLLVPTVCEKYITDILRIFSQKLSSVSIVLELVVLAQLLTLMECNDV